MIKSTFFRKNRSGQALVEFALVAPVLLLLVVGILEFGRAWQTYQIITHPAREGARLSVTPSATDADVNTLISERLNDGAVSTSDAVILLKTRDGTGTRDTVQVSYNYHFRLLGPLMHLVKPGGAEPGTITLSTRFVMRNE